MFIKFCRNKVFIGLAFFLLGCGRSSEVKQIEPGLYSLVTRSFLATGARAEALKKSFVAAEEYCFDRYKKKPLVRRIIYSKSRPWSKALIVTITFSCLEVGDPRLQEENKIEPSIEDYTNRIPNPFGGLFKQK